VIPFSPLTPAEAGARRFGCKRRVAGFALGPGFRRDERVVL
jgi:hypothetical protein